MTQSRRTFLKTLAAGAGALAVAKVAPVQAQEPEQPNQPSPLTDGSKLDYNLVRALDDGPPRVVKVQRGKQVADCVSFLGADGVRRVAVVPRGES